MNRIAVVGGGAWGTALAAVAARKGARIRLYARDSETVAAINEDRENRRYLPGIALPHGLLATARLAEALEGAAIVLLVVPAQTLGAVVSQMSPFMPDEVPLVLCSKGIEATSGRFGSQIVSDLRPNGRVAVLSGPSFAHDVAAGLPTAVTLAARDPVEAEWLAATLSSATFRIYASADIRGVEAGGALKNVLALAAGAVAGRGLGASAQAAIVTRGLSELRRLGEALGGRSETIAGLSGLGDLVLTCGSAQSRNFAYGFALGRGDDLSGLKLAEGVATAGVAARLAVGHGIEAPIVETVAALLDRRLSMGEAIDALLSRPLRREED